MSWNSKAIFLIVSNPEKFQLTERVIENEMMDEGEAEVIEEPTVLHLLKELQKLVKFVNGDIPAGIPFLI